MEKIIITGVAGFIGAAVAKRFDDEGYQVFGVDDLSNGYETNIPTSIEFIQGDLAEEETIKRLPLKCKKILHLAGQSSGEISFDDPTNDLIKNTISTLNLINYGLNNHSERLIYASSMSVYGNVEDAPITENQRPRPLSCYGVGKYAAENYLKVYHKKLPYVALRLFNVYGPGQDLNNLRQGMVSIFLAQALKNNFIQVKGDRSRFRDFIYIDDVVDVWFRASNYDQAVNKTYNVGTGVRLTVGDVIEAICSSIPNTTFEVKGSTPGDQHGIYADNSTMKKDLEFKEFIDFKTGIDLFVDWAKLQKF